MDSLVTKCAKKRAGDTPTLILRQNRKPVSVLFCHLSSRPTPRKRAGSPLILADIPVYMVFLVLVPSPLCVATQRRELLPHGFTLTLAGGLFSVTACKRLLPSVLSTAGCPFQSGLSSGVNSSDRSFYLLFISKLTFKLVVFSVYLRNSLLQTWSDVFTSLMALH